MNWLHNIKRCLLLPVILIITISASAQEVVKGIEITDKEVVISLDRSVGMGLVDSVFQTFGMKIQTLDSLWNQAGQRDVCTDQGWCVRTFNEKELVIVKAMDELYSEISWSESPMIVDDDWIGFAGDPNWIEPTYGINEFRDKTVTQLPNGKTQFLLPDYEKANKVHLSGSFNSWSTLGMPMEKTEEGWTKTVDLKPGKHLYKYIVDGNWISDPENKQTEPDGHGGKNSIYFVYNYTFTLDSFQDARKVYLAGSFNNFDPKELRMEPSPTGWKLPMFLKEGTHAYKFVVDKEWILDPFNPVTRPDGRGNYNSFIAIGDTFYFHLDNYENASEVVVTGNFNAWNERELAMTKTDSGWVMPYVLAPGNYEYKYIVDGRWMIDSSNPHTIGTGDYINSILTIDPNHTFRLRNHEEAEQVWVTGNFNGWNENGYTMEKVDDGWEMDLHLEPGKYRYKFVVDGKWILDPGNELYEENEYGTGNSVIWVEPGEAEAE